MLYKKLRNDVTRELRKSEAEYWKEQFRNAATSKEFWNVVNKLKRKQKDHRIGPLKDEDGELLTNDTKKADLMNRYFTQIGQKLSKAIHHDFDPEDVSYISRITPTCSKLQSNEDKFQKQLKDIKPEKAMGYDQVGSKEFKIADESIKPGLWNIIIKSLSDNKYPDSYKLAIMKTLNKKGEKSDTENCRPLSPLSMPSKLFEGQVCHLLDKHLEEAGIGHQNHWGFRKGRSTEELLLYLTETWKQALDDNYYVGVLFIDFKKAFDSVNRDILKRKRQAAGICGDMYEWLCDYMDGRKQYAKVNGKKSTIRVIVFGVPQGSLLGPRLFSIHFSDLPDFIYEGYLFMFADDTTMYCIGKNIEDVIDQLNGAARELYEWCRKNQLTVHTGKTEAMIISHKNFTGP